MADGIATNVFIGRCYNQCMCNGGMTTHGRYYVMADGKPLAEYWQMLQPCGRWNSHFLDGFISVYFGTAKELARILKPLVEKSAYSVQNTRDFVDQLKNLKLQPKWHKMEDRFFTPYYF